MLLAVTAGAFLLAHLGSNGGALLTPSRILSNPLKTDCKGMSLLPSGYLELGMFYYAAMVLEEIAPEDKNRSEVLGARVDLYMAAKKWEMAEAIAKHLVEIQPENEAWWIDLAHSVRQIEGVEKAETNPLLGASSPPPPPPRI